jgi:hypothetical protein
MARTFTYDVTVAEISAGSIYGFEDNVTKKGDMVHTDGYKTPTYPPVYKAVGNVTTTDGTGEDVEMTSFTVYSSGIEAFTADTAPPYETFDGAEITEIRIAHSGGTKTFTSADWAGSAGNGFIYLWFPDTDVIWDATDIGLTYSVEIDTNAAPAVPPPSDPDYNQGTVITNRKNPGGGIIPEAEYTTTQTLEVRQEPRQTGRGNGGGKGAGGGQVIIDLPPQAGTFDLTCHLEGYDFGSGTWYNILSGANITAGTTRQRLRVAPFIADVVNQSANDVLPYLWRCRIEHGDATAVTYSVEYKLL